MSGNFLLRKTLSTMQTEFVEGNFVRCNSRWKYVNKTQPFNMFYYIINGRCSVEIGGEKLIARPGQMVLLPHYHPLTLSLAGVDFMDKYWCGFYSAIGGADIFDLIKTKHVINVDDTIYVEDLFDRLLTYPCYKNEEADIIKKNATLSLIIAYFIEHAYIDGNEAGRAEYDFESVIAYMKSNIQKDISVSELARLLHLNTEYFLRLFKKHFGITPAKLLARFRMEIAEKLLIETKSTVSEIAKEVGINDVQYFTKVFKSSHGNITPAEFRNNTKLHASVICLSKQSLKLVKGE